MSKAKQLGSEEVVIEDQSVSGCMTYAAPVICVVAGYFARSSWHAITGAESPIIDDSKVLNLLVGLSILGASLFFCVGAVFIFIEGLWKTKMKFYERGVTLHGVEAAGRKSRFSYAELGSVRITEKHNMRDPPAPRGGRRDLLDVAVDALAGVERKQPPKVYESTEYTFSFKPRREARPTEFRLTLHRDGGEVPAIVERLKAEGVEAERVEAKEGG